MLSTYEQTKSNVIKAYEEFLPLVQMVKGGKDSSYDSSLDALADQIKNIKADKFLLMVAGEAKSGKSTFINAYLGEEILPMDVKQCTSAIVVIKYGEKFILRATYADNRVKIIEKEQAIKDFLIANAAMNDNYRDIPVAAINYELLIKYQGKNIPAAVIQDFIRGVKDENLYHLPQTEYEQKIRDYIRINQPQWQNIVQQMEIEYPFADADLKTVEIVDSPGVNADGRVGNITDDYVQKANAVMFLKPIGGAALEASSFKRFLNSKSADRNRNAMFLILTRAANETLDNVNTIHKEALRQFPNINEKQIIPIDSKVKLFYNKAKRLTAEELSAFIQEETAANRLDSFIAMPWLTSNGNRDVFLDKLLELSQFNKIDLALNQFSHKIQYIALNDFLARMIGVIDKVVSGLTENIEFYKEKAVDPIELGNKMNKVKAELEEMTLKLNKTVEDIVFRYTETGGFIDQSVCKEVNNYKSEVDRINADSSSSVDELEKISFRRIDKLTQFSNDIQKEIVAECDKALMFLSDKSTIKYSTLKPDLTRASFQEIKNQSEPEAYEDYSYSEGICFKKTKHDSRFSQAKYFKLVKDDIVGRITKLQNQIIRELKAFVNATTTKYSEELARNAKIKREELNTIVQEKQTAEEIQATVVELEGIIAKLQPMSEYLQSLKGGIEKHV